MKKNLKSRYSRHVKSTSQYSSPLTLTHTHMRVRIVWFASRLLKAINRTINTSLHLWRSPPIFRYVRFIEYTVCVCIRSQFIPATISFFIHPKIHHSFSLIYTVYIYISPDTCIFNVHNYHLKHIFGGEWNENRPLSFGRFHPASTQCYWKENHLFVVKSFCWAELLAVIKPVSCCLLPLLVLLLLIWFLIFC